MLAITLGGQAVQAIDVDRAAGAIFLRTTDAGAAGAFLIFPTIADGGQGAAISVAAKVQRRVAGYRDTGAVSAAHQSIFAGNRDVGRGASADCHSGLAVVGLDVHIVKGDRNIPDILTDIDGVAGGNLRIDLRDGDLFIRRTVFLAVVGIVALLPTLISTALISFHMHRTRADIVFHRQSAQAGCA